jgi:transposase
MVHRILRRKNYPSDLTDEQWAILEPMIPPAKQSNRGGRPRTVDMREVLNTSPQQWGLSRPCAPACRPGGGGGGGAA